MISLRQNYMRYAATAWALLHAYAQPSNIPRGYPLRQVLGSGVAHSRADLVSLENFLRPPARLARRAYVVVPPCAKPHGQVDHSKHHYSPHQSHCYQLANFYETPVWLPEISRVTVSSRNVPLHACTHKCRNEASEDDELTALSSSSSCRLPVQKPTSNSL